MRLANLRISHRLLFAFTVVIALMAVSLGVTLQQLHVAETRTAQVAGEQTERLAIAREWYLNIAVNSQRAIAAAIGADDAVARHFAERMKATSARTTVLQKRYAELDAASGGSQALLDEMAAIRKRYLDARDALLRSESTGDVAGAAAQVAGFEKLSNDYVAVAGRLVEHETRRSEQMAAAVVEAIDATRRVNVCSAG